MVSLYDAESGTAALYPLAATRADASAELSTPYGWTGRNVQVLAFFLSEGAVGGTDSKQLISDSVWGGNLQLD
jgi:hypothetical protein